MMILMTVMAIGFLALFVWGMTAAAIADQRSRRGEPVTPAERAAAGWEAADTLSEPGEWPERAGRIAVGVSIAGYIVPGACLVGAGIGLAALVGSRGRYGRWGFGLGAVPIAVAFVLLAVAYA